MRSEYRAIAEAAGSLNQGILMLLAPGEHSDGMMVNFTAILILREVEGGEGAAATTALGLEKGIFGGHQPTILLLNNCVEVIYLANRVFSSVLSFNRVLTACDGNNIEH